MHSQILVTVNKDATLDTSEKARMYVLHYLFDEGFVAQGRFTSPYGDSCVIGGNWSGLLADKEHDLVKIFGRFMVEGKLNVRRAYGHNDDAQVVTKELYERFLKRFEEGSEGVYESDNSDGVWFREEDEAPCVFLDTAWDEERVSADFIGQKWLVLVDLMC